MAQRLKTDWVLFLTIVVMACFGLVMVYSASSVVAELKFSDGAHFFYRQFAWAVVSFFVLMYFKRTNYRIFCAPAWAFAPLGIVLILQIAVAIVDTQTHRWLRMGALGSLQPSEFAKPALVVFLAYFITFRQKTVNSRYTLLPAALALVVLAAAVGYGDLGTAIVLLVPAAVCFYVAGLEYRYVTAALALGLVCCCGLIVAKPYRLARIVSYTDPEYRVLDTIDPGEHIKKYISQSNTTRDAAYQPRQSKIAVGSGGALGLGLMQGLQKIFYLPEAHTDFIFAVIGEELGFLGCSAVLAGFVLIFWRGLRLFWIAHDDFGRYLALGITSSIVIQAFINMSVVLDMGPTKGIPLPMISAGGSSLLSTLICLGLLLSVSENAG
ncbi:MAG TPA: putative peptidoglycan glycosyltransferase FtsW [Bryobacteraceae bacterium]|nr:putative peptidoglycan glycosyltransferase FtsW [Bryobacteraceae bacterium]